MYYAIIAGIPQKETELIYPARSALTTRGNAARYPEKLYHNNILRDSTLNLEIIKFKADNVASFKKIEVLKKLVIDGHK